VEQLRAQQEWLLSVTGMLAGAASDEEVARIAIAASTDALGAANGALWFFDAETGVARLACHARYTEAMLAAFARFSLSADLPVAVALRERRPLWFSRRAQYAGGYPEVEARTGPVANTHVEAFACLPLLSGERLLGVLALAFSEAHAFDDEERRFLSTLTQQCAQAIERARLYSEAREAARRAEEASRMKDEFLAILGHELRNPLAPITTALSLMEMRGMTGFERERAVIARQVQHLTRLVDDLLDVSRITRGKVELSRQRVELAEVVEQAIETTSPLLEQRQQRLSVQVPRDGLPIDADPVRMQQVVSNLLANAAKYTDVGGCIALSAAAEGGEVALRVEDSGMGIEPEMLPRIFDLFVQEHQAMDRARGGLGLGLSIVQSLVKLHGGSVSATSEGRGRGSEFTVRLPLAPREADAGAISQAAASPRPASRADARRVLVVDDNEDAAELLAEQLALTGNVTRTANDGPSALRILAEFPADVAVLDIGLPVMDGYELARRIRETRGAAMRLVAVTGYGQESDRSRSREAGFDAHLVKPVDMEELMRAVEGR
jgi:signal transduction histidine kinase